MKEIKETCYRGTRILLGNEKRTVINKMVDYMIDAGFTEISIPILQYQETFVGKVGEENNNLMFNFTDRGNRNICLSPEYTAVIQKLAATTFKNQKDIKLFYVQECFRGEKPQSGRYRQFTQFGVEIVNPTRIYTASLITTAIDLLEINGIIDYEVDWEATRGLSYYNSGKGFEIRCEALGSARQVCGGGSYENGIGFAIGIDRILNLIQ